MDKVRHVERVVFSTDDVAVPITITYPSPLRQHELSDLEELLRIWVRSQRRRSESPAPTPVCADCGVPMIPVSHDTWHYDCEHGELSDQVARSE